MNLAQKNCIPCKGGVPPLSAEEQQQLLAQLSGWEIVNGHHLSKTYRSKSYAESLKWVNELSAIAERQGHHPDVYLSWGKTRVDIWTHKIDGLQEADFVLAAKFDEAYYSVSESGGRTDGTSAK